MLKVKDKVNLYQWDVNQVFTGCTSSFIDFIIDADVYRVAVNAGACLIPDEFLQTAGNHTVFEVYKDGTISKSEVHVIERPTPPDYIYTPTQKETFESLVAHVNDAVSDMYAKAARGDFDGKDYVITESDYAAIAEVVKESIDLSDLEHRVDILDNETLDIYEKLETKQDTLIAGSNITIEGNVISATGGGGTGDVTKEYLEENYYDKEFFEDTVTLETTGDYTELSSVDVVYEGLVNNNHVLSDPEKLKIENWLGLSENYLTYYNNTPYIVDSDYVPAHKKYVDDTINGLNSIIGSGVV